MSEGTPSCPSIDATIRAATHGRSMEDEANNILKAVLAQQETTAANLAGAIRTRLQPLGGVELELSAREPIRDARPDSKTTQSANGNERQGSSSSLEA